MISKRQRKINNGTFPKVNALKKSEVGPVVKFLLKQTISSLGSIEFSQAWHFKGAGIVILETQPWANRNYTSVCSSLLVWSMDKTICAEKYSL